VVLEFFGRYVDGASCRTIASELNARGIPSPGSSWKRVQRRCGGWMGSAIRAMLKNERYVGLVVWNQSEWGKDPDSGKRIRRERRDGHACSNSILVRRDRAEEAILGAIQAELLSPARVQIMAREMQSYYNERMGAQAAAAVEAPKELVDLGARICRLHERLAHGDPDMTTDEIQAAIDRAETKRLELKEASGPKPSRASNIPSALPRAANLYKRQIALGLNGDRRAADKARVLLRDWFGGRIRLVPQPDGGLIANWNLHNVALLKAVGSVGSGGRI